MAYVVPTTRSDGYVVDATEWNKNTVDNPIALKALIDANTTSIAAVGVQRNATCGRLSLTTALPVTTSDVTGASAVTLYYALYGGNQIALYSGSAWVVFAISELSIAVPATTVQMYDVFVDYNSGTPALSLTAWTNDTTRATALTKQDGVFVLTGSTGKRYVGSMRTASVSGQTEDSLAKRYVWNYYNRVPRRLSVNDATASWTYQTATVRQARATATNQVDVVVGVAEAPIDLTLTQMAINDGGNAVASGIGENSTTAFTQGVWMNGANVQALNTHITKVPAVGRTFYAWLESSTAAGTTTWYGTNTIVGGATASGLAGWIMG